MSNSNNLGKEIKRLRKEIADLGAQDSAFHFVVGDANETAEAKLDRMKAEGKIQPGTHTSLSTCRGSSTSSRDQRTSPKAIRTILLLILGYRRQRRPPPTGASNATVTQRWKEHLRKIERDGDRYDPDKKNAGGWR